ncbi:MAG: hypothetical protein WCP98_18700 [Actinomycetes bacterium]
MRLRVKGRRTTRSARRGYAACKSRAAEARALVAGRSCGSGRPSCGRSPRRGNLNEPPSKAGAGALVAAILACAKEGLGRRAAQIPACRMRRRRERRSAAPAA